MENTNGCADELIKQLLINYQFFEAMLIPIVVQFAELNLVNCQTLVNHN